MLTLGSFQADDQSPTGIKELPAKVHFTSPVFPKS
jgi:hypothetical protein